MLIAICRYYGTSADYPLGLTDIDPSDEARKQRQRLTEEEQNEMHATKNICCGNAKNKPPSETVRSLGGCFIILIFLTTNHCSWYHYCNSSLAYFK